MAKNCDACTELQEKAAEFVVSGVTDSVCNSLKNDKGFSTSSGNDDCTDLNNANDCLVGNMEDEIDAYDVCDWKDYTKKFVHNIWTVLKATICAICGALARLAKLECTVNGLTKTQNFSISEDKIERFNDVQFNKDPSNPDLSIPAITGNAYAGYMTGSLILPSNFESRFPSSSINTHGILLYEYRVKLSDFHIKRFWPGQMQENANGSLIHAHIYRFTPNSPTRPYAAGDTGYASYSVPDGYEYLQVRISSYDNIPSSGKITLAGVLPVLMDTNNFDC